MAGEVDEVDEVVRVTVVLNGLFSMDEHNFVDLLFVAFLLLNHRNNVSTIDSRFRKIDLE
jgi:hypothetical protein